MNKTSIPWTTWTFNPVTGCTKISEGCQRCYAQALAHRFKWPKQVVLHPERLAQPLRQGKPGDKVFVCSTSDLFHDDVPFEYINKVWGVMLARSDLTFQVLTKRPARMREFFAGRHHPWQAATGPDVPAPNIWLGVTAESQARADERIPLLLQVPAAKRFVSMEPLLSRIHLGPENCHVPDWSMADRTIDWVIAGCEAGPGRRPMDLDWVRSLRDQCAMAGVPFFFKQADVDGKVTAEPTLDGRQWLELPA